MASSLDALESLVLTSPIKLEGVLAMLDNKALDYLVLHKTGITSEDAMQVTRHRRPSQLRHFHLT